MDDRGWQVTAKGKIYPDGQYPQGFARMISEGYLEAMGIPLLEGRGFTEQQDTVASEPVVIVNETLARTLWPGQDAVGQILIADGMKDQEHGRRVVGVVADVHHRALELEPGCELYSPIRQTKNYGSVYLVVRSAQAPGDLAASIRTALRPVAPETSSAELFTMHGTLDRTVAPRRFVVCLLAGFAVFALMLAALGIYAVISYSVNQRTQEVGIRVALGARPGDVPRLVVGQGALLAVVGIAAGLAAAFRLSRVLESLLFGVTTPDPLVYAAGVGLLAAVALAACAVPARRAPRVDPLVALRQD